MAKPAPITHQHYNYRMKFNDIQKGNCTSICNLKETKDRMDAQASNEYWKRLWRDSKNEDYIAFSGGTHCAMVDTNVESIPASRATASRNYRLNYVPTAEGLGLSINPSNFTSCNMDFFSSGVLSVDIVKQRMRQIRTSVFQAWNSSNINQALSLFDNCDELWQNVVKVDKELQFNSWLFDGMKTDLKPRGFNVAANQLNRTIVPSVCEYSNSISDCVIYHPNTLFKARTLRRRTLVL